MTEPDPELIQALDAYLAGLARTGRTVTYAEAAGELGLQPPQTIHRLAVALEAVMTRDAEAGRPLRAALVVSRTAPLPKPGFFDHARKLGRYDGPSTGDEAARYHAAELERVTAAHGSPSKPGPY